MPRKPFWRATWFGPTFRKNSVGMSEGESEKDFWVQEKVTCEELRLCSLESREGGRAVGRCPGYGAKVMFAEDAGRRNHPTEPRRFGPYTAGSFLALRTPPWHPVKLMMRQPRQTALSVRIGMSPGSFHLPRTHLRFLRLASGSFKWDCSL